MTAADTAVDLPAFVAGLGIESVVRALAPITGDPMLTAATVLARYEQLGALVASTITCLEASGPEAAMQAWHKSLEALARCDVDAAAWVRARTANPLLGPSNFWGPLVQRSVATGDDSAPAMPNGGQR